MSTSNKPPVPMGRLQKAPEGFLSGALIHDIAAHGLDETRRGFLKKSFLAAGAALAAGSSIKAAAKQTDGSGAISAASASVAQGDPMILQPRPWSTMLGNPVAFHPYGTPSKYEANLLRRQSPGLTPTAQASVAFAPLQGFFGIITPNGLHFERHHQGWVDVDPEQHRFMINGMVKEAKVYTMDDLMRLPAVSKIHFIECGANTGMEWGNAAVPTVQYTHGMLSCCEFTGVPLKILLDDCGADLKNAKFILAEGNDGSSMTRTISLEAALDDAIVAWGMNGEMLRPENGYPLRLVVPGVQGVSWVKWLRRIKVGDKPWNAKDETSHYVDLMPDGTMRQYTSIQECKSVITSPSGGQVLLGQGFFNVSGLAWSGRGKIKQVDVSFDGGRNWKTARLETPILDKCLTRFNIDWVWDGSPVILQSRATDSTGFVQPRYSQLREMRGTRSTYHNNAIQSWKVAATGEVFNVHVD